MQTMVGCPPLPKAFYIIIGILLFALLITTMWCDEAKTTNQPSEVNEPCNVGSRK